ncbi:MAG: DUF4153 domain-containing protein [Treponema sp.]|nr:DUF4153 domain-containing protein [Treponema sp.]
MEKLSFRERIQKTLGYAAEYLSFAKVIFVLSFAAFVFASLDECLPAGKKIDYEELTKAFLMSALFALPATLLTKGFACVKKYAVQTACAAAGFALGYFSCRGFGDSVFEELYYYGILFAGIMISLFIFIPEGNGRTYFALVFKHALFSTFMTLILTGGISLLIYAVQNLILNTNKYKAYTCGVYFCAFVFGINTFAHYLFNRREDRDSGKAFRIIALYILLPVCSVLILILYAYLIKALVLFKLPTGQINWFVSFASCSYIVFYFILREYDELPAIKFFYRFGALIFIPLVIIQIYAYYIRVSAFGFTGYRYSSLLFIIFSLITFALTFVRKGRYINCSVLILAFIILFDSVSPFNLINMAYKSQYSIMMGVMEKYGLFDKESDSLREYDREELERTITDDDRAALLSSYRYIHWTSKIPKPAWTEVTKTNANGTVYKNRQGFSELFGIKETREQEEIARFAHFVSDENQKGINFDIRKFSEMSIIDKHENASYADGNGTYSPYRNGMPAVTFTDNTGREHDLTTFIFSAEVQEHKSAPIWYSPDEHTTLCFTSINYEYNKTRKLFGNYEVKGYLFRK